MFVHYEKTTQKIDVLEYVGIFFFFLYLQKYFLRTEIKQKFEKILPFLLFSHKINFPRHAIFLHFKWKINALKLKRKK